MVSKFVYSPDLLDYHFSNEHPFNQHRMQLTYSLLKELNLLKENQIIPPRIASDEELFLVHEPKYIDFIKRASENKGSLEEAQQYGVGTTDTPIFKNMHEATARIVGGTIQLADEICQGRIKYGINLSGGLHHGFSNKASGFCIYNDCSVAIKHITKNYGLKVLYIDTDAHHGDGVQWSFYNDPQVCTLSLHETGRYLFPGTGDVSERGTGKGYGYCFNIPLDAFTEDDSFLTVYEQAFSSICEHFQPDIILSQNGADAHYFDPLTHLNGSSYLYEQIPRVAKRLADQYCQGRWLAVGGGGYDWKAVTRAWAQIWLTMNDMEAPTGKMPPNFLKQLSKFTNTDELYWQDDVSTFPTIERKVEIEQFNQHNLTRALSIFHSI